MVVQAAKLEDGSFSAKPDQIGRENVELSASDVRCCRRLALRRQRLIGYACVHVGVQQQKRQKVQQQKTTI